MKISDLKELLELIAERDITEFELEEEGVRLRIRKGATGLAVSGAPALVQPVHHGPDAASRVHTGESTDASSRVRPEEDGLSVVTAPMVGTFYRQPEPGAEPFAKTGDRIKKGQVLCIIEAMKLMNEIESELQGELVDVFVENGQAVQYGDKLFAIREG